MGKTKATSSRTVDHAWKGRLQRVSYSPSPVIANAAQDAILFGCASFPLAFIGPSEGQVQAIKSLEGAVQVTWEADIQEG